jgi:hypothetical protein
VAARSDDEALLLAHHNCVRVTLIFVDVVLQSYGPTLIDVALDLAKLSLVH